MMKQNLSFRIPAAAALAAICGLITAPAALADEPVGPLTLEIHTVPSLPGIAFSLNDVVFVSDASGIALAQVPQAGTYQLTVLPVDQFDADTRIEFSRWSDAAFRPSRDVKIKSDMVLQAGFDVSHRVSQTFVDLAGNPVPPSRIQKLVLKNSIGVSYTLDDGQPRWFQTSRVVRRQNLETSQILYSVDSVYVDGSSVVHASQQHFVAHPNDVWQIELLLYAARFSARDALFGVPIGTGVHLEYPSGRAEVVNFGPNGDVVVGSLARGYYRAYAVGAAGFAPHAPVALSKVQDVRLVVISFVDMAIGVLVGASAALGLLLSGRPEILLGRRATLATPAAPRSNAAPKRQPFRNPIPLFTVAVLVLEIGTVGLLKWAGRSVWQSGDGSTRLPSMAVERPANDDVQPTTATPSKPQRVAPTPETRPTEMGQEFVPLTGAETYIVQPGDTLQKIAKYFYGDPKAWKTIYEANRETVKDPDRIFRGQQLVIPGDQAVSPQPAGQ